MASSVLADIGSQLETAKQNGFRKDFTFNMADSKDIQKEIIRKDKDISFRLTSEQLALIETHNNDAIKSGRNGYISDGGEDSGTELDGKEYRRHSIDRSSYSTRMSTSEDETDITKTNYEHYDPERFEQNDNSVEEDDCKFGKSTNKAAVQEVLHQGAEIRPNVSDDFGGWDVTFTVKSSKPSKVNFRRPSKTLRVTSAFPRPTTETKDTLFTFRHHEDVSDHIKQYREEQCVQQRLAKDGDEGILVPDPYASKLKNNMCSIAENCDFLAVYSSNSKDKMRESNKDKASSTTSPRSRPSSLIYYPTYDSDDDGLLNRKIERQERPKSLVFFPTPDSRTILPKLRNSTLVCSQLKSDITRYPKAKLRPYSESCLPKDSDLSPSSRQSSRLQPRPLSDHPFVVRTLTVKDRSKTLNLAPVRNQDSSVNHKSFQPNISLEHYLNLVVPHRERQLRRSNSNLSNYSTDDKDDTKGQKPALHKKNLQLNITGPCDPWTPKFEFKRSPSRGAIALPNKPSIGSAGNSQRKSSSPDINMKQWVNRPEYGLSRANTYHSNYCQKSDTIDKELTVNAKSSRNPPYVQRVYGQRYRCCERIHALISSDIEEANRRIKDKHIKLPVDNLKCEKPSPLSFGSFGIRRGMTREESSMALTSVHKLKREGRQRRFNLSLVK